MVTKYNLFKEKIENGVTKTQEVNYNGKLLLFKNKKNAECMAKNNYPGFNVGTINYTKRLKKSIDYTKLPKELKVKC